MATIRDIAERLGVSIGTVSKGLNGARDISEELRQSILDTAVEMGYTKRQTGKKGHRTLALVIENMEYTAPDDFGFDIVLGFRQAAIRNHWDTDLVPVSSGFQETHSYSAFVLEKGYAGCFLLGFTLDDPWMKELETTTVPTVLLDNFVSSNPHVSYIGTDSEEALDASISHLIGLGHEKIGFLDGPTGSMIFDHRMTCYLASMKKHHLQVDPDLAVYSFYTADAARLHVPGMLSLGATAFLCGNDLIALGVIDGCRESGLRVPEDVSVIGFDDVPAAAKAVPPLTTVRQDRLSLGKSACFTLDAMMNQTAISKTLLRPQLVIRASTALAKPRLVTQRAANPDSVLQRNPLLYARFM